MNNQRLLFGAAWLTSLVMVYVVASSREPVASPAHSAGSRSALGGSEGANPGSEPGAGTRDRTLRRSMDQLEDVEKTTQANIPHLVAKARLQLGGNGMMSMRSMMLALAPLLQLDDSQIPEALAEVERTTKEPQQKMQLYSVLLSQWAETDGRAAWTYAEEKLGIEGPFDMGIKGAIIAAWAGQDPDGVWAWFQTQKKDSLSDPMPGGVNVIMLFSGMASKDLDTALQRVAALDGSLQGMALNGIASFARDRQGRARLFERAASLPGDQKIQIYQLAAVNWVMTEPEEMVKWMRTLPPGEQKSVIGSAGEMLLMTKPDLGAELVLEQAGEKEKAEAYERIANQWVSRDAKATGEWLAKQPQGPGLDGARNVYARAVVLRDPAGAMEWAKSVQDDGVRASAVEHVFQVWRMKDGPAADAALETARLPEEKVKQLKASPAPKPSEDLKRRGF